MNNLYSGEDEVIHFEADCPFLYHIWDRKTNTTVFSGYLKEFEGKKRKIVYPSDQAASFCVDVNGKKSSCDGL